MSSTLIPPPVVAALVAASMWAVDAALPGVRVIVPLRGVIVALLSVVALALMVAAVAALWRARTTLNPLHPERVSALVTGGIFARSRNPIYLGDGLLLAAWAVWLGNAAAAPLPALFVLWMARLQIPAEEAALRAHFGTAFEGYSRRVRRWL